MLITVIQVKNYSIARQQVKQAASLTDGIELRLDYWPEVNIQAISALRCEYSLPMIFTLRRHDQGGAYVYSENERLETIRRLCQCCPDYFDLEYDISSDFVQEIKTAFPQIKLIGSYHNFKETPSDLTGILNSMQLMNFDYYKIATMAQGTLDALQMLLWITQQKNPRLTGLCMGEQGQCTRILAPIVGCVFKYACIESKHATALGQLTLESLRSDYHLHKLNSDSNIYALIGDPIQQSIGHIAHNIAIRFLHKNAVYVKLKVTQAELRQVLTICRQLPFVGFSVTMPLKEMILPFLDEIEEAAYALKVINTISKYVGFNTDGLGAINALSALGDVSQQKLVILGAGGAARAIAYAAVQKNASVIILNRTLAKAKKLADELGCAYAPLNQWGSYCLGSDYNVIVNTIPEQTLVKKIKSSPNRIVMNLVYSESACPLGYAMYVHQALLQIKHWFEPSDQQLEILKNALIYVCKDKTSF
jgi:3-dehydroquinate dehydratase/shikimate dehydrogenase